jgi:lysophospholipase L1-like esterase
LARYGAAAVCALALGEGLVRWVKPYSTPDTLRAKSIQFERTSYARHALARIDQPASGITSRGYRGPAFDVPKRSGTIRIVVMGGSGAFDIHAAAGRDWPHLVQQTLNQRGHSSAEVVNAGIPGLATPDVAGIFLSEVWSFQPDIVVLYESWNDIKYMGGVDPGLSLLRYQRPPPGRADSPLVSNPLLYYANPLDRFLCHSQLYVRLRSRYFAWQVPGLSTEGAPRPTSGAITPYGLQQYELAVRAFVDEVVAAGATPVLLTQARLPLKGNEARESQRIRYEYVGLSHEALVDAFEDCDHAIAQTARERGVPSCDVAQALNGRHEAFEDHVHLSSIGSQRLAEAVADCLGPLIDGKNGAAGKRRP